MTHTREGTERETDTQMQSREGTERETHTHTEPFNASNIGSSVEAFFFLLPLSFFFFLKVC